MAHGYGKQSGTDPPARAGDARDPTFVEVGGGHRARAAPAPPPSTSGSYSAYNPLAVERYDSTTFVDVTLEPVAALRKQPPAPQTMTNPASLSRGIHRALQLQHWKQRFDAVLAGKGGRRLRRGFAGGAAIATLMGGLLLGSGSQANVSAQEPTPPPPPVKKPGDDDDLEQLAAQFGDYRPIQDQGDGKPRKKPAFEEVGRDSRSGRDADLPEPPLPPIEDISGSGRWLPLEAAPIERPKFVSVDEQGDPIDEGAVDRLIACIGEDSPLWQFIEPGDGSTLWQLVTRIGADSALWDRLAELDADHPLWDRIKQLGADSPRWERVAQDGDDSALLEFIEQAGDAGPRREGRGDGDSRKPTDAGGPGGLGATASSDVLPFEERFDEDNPLRDPVEVGEYPKPALVDIDGDGDLDVFVGSKYYGIYFFENTGDDENPVFVQRYWYDNPLYYVYSYHAAPTFVDIDGDGDFDAFVGGEYYVPSSGWYGHIRFFQNLSQEYYGDNQHPIFYEQYGYNNPLSMVDANRPVPTFVDIDSDGDFDAFVGDGCSGGYGGIRYFRNYSQEYYGDDQHPIFHEQYGYNNPLYYVRVCYAAPSFVDIDGDGDFDAFVGQCWGYSYVPYYGWYSSYGGVRYFRNFSQEYYGSDAYPTFHEGIGPFNPLNRMYGGYTAPAFADIDGDGDFDAFVGHYEYYYGYSFYDDIRYFENTGGAYTPAFTRRGGPAYPFGGVGGHIDRPTLVDVDGDGDLDAFVGHDSWGWCKKKKRRRWRYYDPVRYFENIGDDQNPLFAERFGADNPLYKPAYSYSYSYSPYYYWREAHSWSDTSPTFVDIDGDGDFDAFVGGYNYHYYYYDDYDDGYYYNYNYYWDIKFFKNLSQEFYSDDQHPVFVETYGPYNPLYGATYTYYPYYGVSYTCRPAPTFVDIDGDGDFDAFVGGNQAYYSFYPYSYHWYGGVRYFRNFSQEFYGDDEHPVFFEGFGLFNPLDGLDYTWDAVPAFVDIDGDGDFDAFIGHYAGWYGWYYDYVRYFENTGDDRHPVFAARYGYYDNPLYAAYYGYYTAPTFGDVNGDGFVDAFVGNSWAGKWVKPLPKPKLKAEAKANDNPFPKKKRRLDSVRYFERVPLKVYMPLVAHDYVHAPDLVVESLVASSDGVTVTIKNEGPAAVTDEFWVDVYIDPSPAPTDVNQVWEMLCDEGLVWGVTADALPLNPGDTLVLTVGGDYYRGDLSNFGGTLPPGTQIYAQVDSAHTGTSYGGVWEIHDTTGAPHNNIEGPVSST
jgi:hypothetical protein